MVYLATYRFAYLIIIHSGHGIMTPNPIVHLGLLIQDTWYSCHISAKYATDGIKNLQQNLRDEISYIKYC